MISVLFASDCHLVAGHLGRRENNAIRVGPGPRFFVRQPPLRTAAR